MPSPRILVRALVALAMLAVLLPQARPAVALDAATFIAKTAAWAQAEEKAHGVPASVAMAQAMLESGMGESGLTKNANNWFGIKCSSTVSPYQNGCYSVSTTEYDSNGNPYTVVAKFRKYDTPELSFIDHGYFLSRLSRYAKAFLYKDNPDRFIVEVHRGGYATDPQYANKVINIMTKYNLYQYNITPPSTAPSELAIRPQLKAFTDATAIVTGLLSPDGAGREIQVQALTAEGWTTVTSAAAGSRGQFSLPLDHAKSTAGKVTYRVVAAAVQGQLTSAEFVLERIGRVLVQPVTTVMVTQTTQLRGSAAGYVGRPVVAQVLVDGVWQDHAAGTVSSSGTFALQLAVGQAEAGTWSVRAVVTAADGKTYPSTIVKATWVPDVYTTEGTHDYNGRQWRTRCEPYSGTTRCFTDIWASTVKVVSGKFVKTSDWTFNNMTYLPSPRSMWATNPLGGYGTPGPKTFTWTSDGREWKAECDTATTGAGGCRAYILADVITSSQTSSGTWRYAWQRTWVFNNIVRFS